MAHQLHRLLQSLWNTPHLITQSSFDGITSYLKERNATGLFAPMGDVEPKAETPDSLKDFDPALGVGVINIQGALTYKPVETLCGAVGCSYEQLLEQTDAMIEAGAKIIVLNIDSGGGQAYGVFECANEIRAMCDNAGVQLFAYNDGCTASAAYALACVCDEVVANPFAETGSIGVLIALYNDSKQLEQAGIVRTFITAGADKVPFAADGSWREGFLEDLQHKVDALYGDFVSHVCTYTGLSPDAVKGTEAKVFSAQEALDLGLINKVMTRSEFVSYIAEKQKGISNA